MPFQRGLVSQSFWMSSAVFGVPVVDIPDSTSFGRSMSRTVAEGERGARTAGAALRRLARPSGCTPKRWHTKKRPSTCCLCEIQLALQTLLLTLQNLPANSAGEIYPPVALTCGFTITPVLFSVDAGDPLRHAVAGTL